MKNIESTQLTRARITAVREGLRRFALPLVGGIIALSLAACETNTKSSGDGLVGSLFGSSSNEQASPTGATGQAAQLAAQAKPLTFAPIIGAPAKISSSMSEKLVVAAGQKNLKVESSNSNGYTVRGYLVAASATSGTKLSYIWDIRDQSGKRAKRFQGDELIEGKKGGDPWALVDDAAIDRIAVSTADKISAWMYGAINTASVEPEQAEVQQTASYTAPAPARTEQRPAQPTASANVLSAPAEQPATPSAPAEIVAVVSPVTGAPGDGEQSLTTAMRRHLTNAGVKLIEGSSPSAYTVKGTVQLGSADGGGQQPITIRWLVVDPAGKQIDKAVVQRNNIPAGSLDGAWGKVADLAASEAAKSIAKLIQPTG